MALHSFIIIIQEISNSSHKLSSDIHSIPILILLMLLTIKYLKLLILFVLLDFNILLIRHVLNAWIIEEISGRGCCRELFNSSYVRRDIEAMDGTFVLRQMIALNKSLIAQLALEAFSRVSSYVGFKIISLTKAFHAKAENETMMSDDGVVCSLLYSHSPALVRFVACVHSHMYEEIVSSLKSCKIQQNNDKPS